MILRLIKNKNLLSDPRVSLIIYLVWIIILVISLIFLGIFNDKTFFAFGPTSDDTFLGNSINTWGKVIILYVISFCTAAFNTYYGSIYGTWLYNQVKDSERKHLNIPKKEAKLMTIISPIITGINDIIGIFILLTQQLQYIIPQILGDVVISIIISHKYIDKKSKFKNKKLTFK